MMDKERLRILRELDVGASLKLIAASGFIPQTEEIALAGLHKVRVIMKTFFSDKEVKRSEDWLVDNGYEVP